MTRDFIDNWDQRVLVRKCDDLPRKEPEWMLMIYGQRGGHRSSLLLDRNQVNLLAAMLTSAVKEEQA